MADKRETPLLDAHKSLGAKLTEFGGWDMPLQYEGIVAEHNAVRNSCGLFDVSHLGKLRITGASGGASLQMAVTADVEALAVGRAKYALVLTEDGGTIDDIFVYRIGPEEWLAVPNASNVAAVADAIGDQGYEVTDEWDRYAILALQGPDSYEVFEKVFPNTGATDLKLHAWQPLDVFGSEGIVARTGYTGERGFEIYAPSDTAERAFTALLDAGAAPVGLGARDTLRLEMGYAVYGHELSLEVNPVEAGLGWAIAWDSPFRGRDALLEVKANGPARKLFGVRCTDKGVPRQGYQVFKDDQTIGEVCSGNFSPTLGVGIALAYGDAGALPEVGDAVAIEARGRRIAGEVAKPPFIG